MHTLLAHIIFHYISFTILLHISVTFFNSYFDSPESESTVHHPCTDGWNLCAERAIDLSIDRPNVGQMLGLNI